MTNRVVTQKMEAWAIENTQEHSFSNPSDYPLNYEGAVYQVDLTFKEEPTHAHKRISVRSMEEAFYLAIEPCDSCLPDTISRSEGVRVDHTQNTKFAYSLLYAWINALTKHDGPISDPEGSKEELDKIIKHLEQESFVPLSLDILVGVIGAAGEAEDYQRLEAIKLQLRDLAENL